jgi:hypothetical protein
MSSPATRSCGDGVPPRGNGFWRLRRCRAPTVERQPKQTPSSSTADSRRPARNEYTSPYSSAPRWMIANGYKYTPLRSRRDSSRRRSCSCNRKRYSRADSSACARWPRPPLPRAPANARAIAGAISGSLGRRSGLRQSRKTIGRSAHGRSTAAYEPAVGCSRSSRSSRRGGADLGLEISRAAGKRRLRCCSVTKKPRHGCGSRRSTRSLSDRDSHVTRFLDRQGDADQTPFIGPPAVRAVDC